MNRNNDLSAERLAIYEEHGRLTDENNAFRLRCANFIKEIAKAKGVKKNTWNGTKYVYKVEGFDLPYPLIRYNVLSISADNNIYPHIETDTLDKRTFYDFENYELISIIEELAKVN